MIQRASLDLTSGSSSLPPSPPPRALFFDDFLEAILMRRFFCLANADELDRSSIPSVGVSIAPAAPSALGIEDVVEESVLDSPDAAVGLLRCLARLAFARIACAAWRLPGTSDPILGRPESAEEFRAALNPAALAAVYPACTVSSAAVAAPAPGWYPPARMLLRSMPDTAAGTPRVPRASACMLPTGCPSRPPMRAAGMVDDAAISWWPPCRDATPGRAACAAIGRTPGMVTAPGTNAERIMSNPKGIEAKEATESGVDARARMEAAA
mmetsp:Transcript_1834/g.4583  ORF Transcript_1834/g.4583 Transcript_1834/m.4583 type:complete len:268 (-) Transcript_1834:875-1678(-)